MIFRDLTPDEEREFADYATQNAPPSLAYWELYHPACREVWCKRGVCPHPPHGGPIAGLWQDEGGEA